MKVARYGIETVDRRHTREGLDINLLDDSRVGIAIGAEEIAVLEIDMGTVDSIEDTAHGHHVGCAGKVAEHYASNRIESPQQVVSDHPTRNQLRSLFDDV